MNHTTAIVALSAIVAMATPSAAIAGSPDPEFTGSCRFAGEVTFSPALTTTPRAGKGSAQATGTCTGTVDVGGRTVEVNRAPSTYRAQNSSPTMSCQGGRADGSGVLTIADTRIGFDLVETRTGGASVLRLIGTNLVGTANIEPSAGVDAVRQCTERGLKSAPIAISLTSTTLG